MDAPTANPLGAAAASTDQVGLAMHAIAAGWSAATALLGLVTYITSLIAESSGATSIAEVTPDDPQVNAIVYGLMASLTAAGAVAWFLMRPVESSFRRFGLSMVAVLGGFLIAAVLTFLARQLVGPAALPVLSVVGFAMVWYFARRALADA